MREVVREYKQHAFNILGNDGFNNELAQKPINVNEVALFLDIDGTIAKFNPSPDAVCLTESMKVKLSELYIQLEGRVVFVTGRDIKSADKVTGFSSLSIAGVHGGEIRIEQQPQKVHQQLVHHDEIKKELDCLVLDFPELFYEDKKISFALHYNQNTKLKNTCHDFMLRMKCLSDDFTLLSGRNVVEIKVNKYDKGTAIDYFMKQSDFTGKSPWFIGDDVTDESGFLAVVQQGGVAIKVLGEQSSIDRVSYDNISTLAGFFLDSVDEVEVFLGRFLKK